MQAQLSNWPTIALVGIAADHIYLWPGTVMYGLEKDVLAVAPNHYDRVKALLDQAQKADPAPLDCTRLYDDVYQRLFAALVLPHPPQREEVLTPAPDLQSTPPEEP